MTLTKSQKIGVVTIKEARPETTIPKHVKEALLSVHLKEKVSDYLTQREEWQHQCNVIQAEHKMQLEEDLLAEVSGPELPPKPKFVIWLSHSELEMLIQRAEKKKSRWERISKETTQRQKANPGLLRVPE